MRVVVTLMIQTLGISLVTVLLLVQLSLLPTRSGITQHFGANRPWMKLPVATQRSGHSDCHIAEELSWTRNGGWVGERGKIREEEIESHLRSLSRRAEESHGLGISVHLRIPANAEAGRFMEAAMAAQRAGVSRLHVAVAKGGVAKF